MNIISGILGEDTESLFQRQNGQSIHFMHLCKEICILCILYSKCPIKWVL